MTYVMGSKYKKVFEPIRIRGVNFKNRLEMAPLSPNLADPQGRISQEFIDFLRPIAKGGVGVIHIGNASIDIKESNDEERQLNLSSDDCILPLSRLVEMCHSYGALASLEINHSGKDSKFENTGKAAVSASSIIASVEIFRAHMNKRKPIPTIQMDQAKIKETIDKYAAAAHRCQKAGFKICMIHGGHGNLISQFASPLYNKRTDNYGGSLENRARFAMEVLDRVREACGDHFVIEYRISADEVHPKGMHFTETLEFINLIQHKIDILHVSAGLHGEFEYMRNWYQNYLMDRLYNVHYAAEIKQAFPNLLVCTVGSIMNIKNAEAILSAGQADFVAMCRPFLADPEMPRKYAQGKEEDHRPCLRCQHCGYHLLIHGSLRCAVNPFLGNEKEFPDGKVEKADVRRKIAVIGGGPAGIQAMLLLCERGHEVTLYEMRKHLGGNAVQGAALQFKQDMKDYLEYLVCQANKAPARILLNTEATKERLDTEGYDAYIIAIGSKPIFPPIPGIDKYHARWAPEIITGTGQDGNKMIIVGAGAVGLECAIDLKRAGNDVIVVDMAPDLSNLMTSAGIPSLELTKIAKELRIPIHFNCMIEERTDNSVIFRNSNTSERIEIPADILLLAIGMSARTDVADALCRNTPETEMFIIGDASKVGTIASAIKSAFETAAYI
jgi:2,4-dienoyl-CoA reductase-like NADH-dependent reductase (Old Yellow Enzyme family)/thioredoxin reductase